MAILSPLSLSLNQKTFNFVTLSAVRVYRGLRGLYTRRSVVLGLGLSPGARKQRFLAQILSISCLRTDKAKSH